MNVLLAVNRDSICCCLMLIFVKTPEDVQNFKKIYRFFNTCETWKEPSGIILVLFNKKIFQIL